YEYDALDNLTKVIQGGQTRSFQYDGLSRLTQATNPESGTVTYTYDGNGNLLTRTDARRKRLTQTFDNLNRLTTKTYSDLNAGVQDVTPAVSYYYDGKDCAGQARTVKYAIGRLTCYASSK